MVSLFTYPREVKFKSTLSSHFKTTTPVLIIAIYNFESIFLYVYQEVVEIPDRSNI
jgi:hypothetical protein